MAKRRSPIEELLDRVLTQQFNLSEMDPKRADAIRSIIRKVALGQDLNQSERRFLQGARSERVAQRIAEGLEEAVDKRGKAIVPFDRAQAFRAEHVVTPDAPDTGLVRTRQPETFDDFRSTSRTVNNPNVRRRGASVPPTGEPAPTVPRSQPLLPGAVGEAVDDAAGVAGRRASGAGRAIIRGVGAANVGLMALPFLAEQAKRPGREAAAAEAQASQMRAAALRNQRLQRLMSLNNQRLAMQDPSLYNELLHERPMATGDVVFGGGRRRETLESVLRLMSEGAFSEEPQI